MFLNWHANGVHSFWNFQSLTAAWRWSLIFPFSPLQDLYGDGWSPDSSLPLHCSQPHCEGSDPLGDCTECRQPIDSHTSHLPPSIFRRMVFLGITCGQLVFFRANRIPQYLHQKIYQIESMTYRATHYQRRNLHIFLKRIKSIITRFFLLGTLDTRISDMMPNIFAICNERKDPWGLELLESIGKFSNNRKFSMFYQFYFTLMLSVCTELSSNWTVSKCIKSYFSEKIIKKLKWTCKFTFNYKM